MVPFTAPAIDKGGGTVVSFIPLFDQTCDAHPAADPAASDG